MKIAHAFLVAAPLVTAATAHANGDGASPMSEGKYNIDLNCTDSETNPSAKLRAGWTGSFDLHHVTLEMDGVKSPERKFVSSNLNDSFFDVSVTPDPAQTWKPEGCSYGFSL